MMGNTVSVYRSEVTLTVLLQQSVCVWRLMSLCLFVRCGDSVGVCSGVLLPHTGFLKAFKMLQVTSCVSVFDWMCLLWIDIAAWMAVLLCSKCLHCCCMVSLATFCLSYYYLWLFLFHTVPSLFAGYRSLFRVMTWHLVQFYLWNILFFVHISGFV